MDKINLFFVDLYNLSDNLTESINFNADHEVYAGALSKSVNRVETGMDKLYFGEIEKKKAKSGVEEEEEDSFSRAFYGHISKQLNEIQLSAIRAVST